MGEGERVYVCVWVVMKRVEGGMKEREREKE